MDFAQLFSFNGRQRRMTFWLIAIVISIINSVVYSMTIGPVYMAALAGHPAAGGFGIGGILGSVVTLVLFWVSLANAVKRCHDRDKSGWWLLLYWLVSLTIIGLIWPLIELGILDGTPGPNRFGPSPKGVTGPAPIAPAAT
jgi:uncharacterized membrane protein YhaH (DUF805 family)